MGEIWKKRKKKENYLRYGLTTQEQLLQLPSPKKRIRFFSLGKPGKEGVYPVYTVICMSSYMVLNFHQYAHRWTFSLGLRFGKISQFFHSLCFLFSFFVLSDFDVGTITEKRRDKRRVKRENSILTVNSLTGAESRDVRAVCKRERERAEQIKRVVSVSVEGLKKKNL